MKLKELLESVAGLNESDDATLLGVVGSNKYNPSNPSVKGNTLSAGDGHVTSLGSGKATVKVTGNDNANFVLADALRNLLNKTFSANEYGIVVGKGSSAKIMRAGKTFNLPGDLKTLPTYDSENPEGTE